MKFKMIMLVMALSAVCMTACGKAEEKKVESAAPESSEIQGESGNAEVESMAPGSYEIQDEGGNATLYIPEEDAEEEEDKEKQNRSAWPGETTSYKGSHRCGRW